MTADELTIDQLAQQTGMTARNVRAHQSRGLVPPPAVRGRTGFYGPEHIERVRLIQELQSDGFSLELVGRLIEKANGSAEQVRDFARALRVTFADEQPEIVDVTELATQWNSTDTRLLATAEKLGLIRSLGDGRYELPSPRLARAGAELAALGVPLEEALKFSARIQRRTRELAALHVGLFVDTFWRPFEEAGHPEDRWPEVREALERLRPLAAESMVAAFQLAMDQEAERAFGRAMARMERGDHRRRRSSHS